jgi:hypothetical protein
VSVDYRRTGETERFTFESRFAKPVALRLQIASRGSEASVTVDGHAAAWRWLDQAGPRSRLEIPCPPSSQAKVEVTWRGPAQPDGAPVEGQAGAQQESAPTSGEIPSTAPDWRTPRPATARLETVDLAPYFNDRVTNVFRHEYRSPRSPFVSLAIPKQGIGGWAGGVDATAEIDDTGLRAVAGRLGGQLVLPNGVPFATPGPGAGRNVVFTSQWDNFPREAIVPLGGQARHVYLLMAGSTNWMQSRLDNGEVIVAYADGTTERLALHNPWRTLDVPHDWSIEGRSTRRRMARRKRLFLARHRLVPEKLHASGQRRARRSSSSSTAFT